MIRHELTYTDFDDQTQTETLWFHLSKSHLTDHFVPLKRQLDEVHHLLSGPKKDMKIEEVVKILDLIKSMVRLSYGVRSEDGKRFRQTDETWQDFRDSPMYDKLLTDFMEKPEDGMDFITKVLPKDLVEQAQDMLPFTDGNAPVAVGTDVQSAVKNPLEGLSPEQIAELVQQAKAQKAVAGP